MRALVSLIAAAAMALPLAAAAEEGGHGAATDAPNWSFSGIFGTYDQAQLRRGFEVYKTVCSGCHSLRLVAYRNLAALGYSEKDIEAIAGEKEVPGEPNESGEPTTRKALPSDRFVPPFANENAARAANNGALPPDLTLVVRARAGGPDYIYNLLTGYGSKAPEFETDEHGKVVKDETGKPVPFKLGDGQYYNAAFPGHKVAMAPPLSADGIEYTDKTKATVPQMARDVVAFLAWTSDPTMEDRKRLGVKVILFLIFLTALLYAIKRKVWAAVH